MFSLDIDSKACFLDTVISSNIILFLDVLQMQYSLLTNFHDEDFNSLFNKERIYRGSSAELIEESKGIVSLSTLIY